MHKINDVVSQQDCHDDLKEEAVGFSFIKIKSIIYLFNEVVYCASFTVCSKDQSFQQKYCLSNWW